MKKYRLLFLSILLFLVSFLAFWFSDWLWSLLWLFVLPIDLILLGSFVALLVFSIRQIIKNRKYVEFASVAMLILLAAVAAWFPFRDAKMKLEWDRYESSRLEVVEMIRNRQLQPVEGKRVISLPAGYRRVSTGGRVIQYQNDEDGLVIGFWIFRGIPDGSIEWIYSSEAEGLIKRNVYGIEKMEKLEDHWYYVEID